MYAGGDPNFAYGRFFHGVVHELRVYDRVLNTSEIVSVSAELNTAWNIRARDAACDANRPASAPRLLAALRAPFTCRWLRDAATLRYNVMQYSYGYTYKQVSEIYERS